MKKKNPILSAASEPTSRNTSIQLYQKDDAAINTVAAQGFKYKIRLTAGQIIRFLIRRGETTAFTEEELLAASLLDDRRRVPKKKK